MSVVKKCLIDHNDYSKSKVVFSSLYLTSTHNKSFTQRLNSLRRSITSPPFSIQRLSYWSFRNSLLESAFPCTTSHVYPTYILLSSLPWHYIWLHWKTIAWWRSSPWDPLCFKAPWSPRACARCPICTWRSCWIRIFFIFHCHGVKLGPPIKWIQLNLHATDHHLLFNHRKHPNEI